MLNLIHEALITSDSLAMFIFEDFLFSFTCFILLHYYFSSKYNFQCAKAYIDYTISQHLLCIINCPWGVLGFVLQFQTVSHFHEKYWELKLPF